MPRKPPPGKRFKKGQSGNPGGRPKYAEISHAIRFFLTLPLSQLKTYEPQTMAEVIALGQIQEAVKKKNPSVQFVANRAEGMPIATVKSQIDLTDSRMVIDILKDPSPAIDVTPQLEQPEQPQE